MTLGNMRQLGDWIRSLHVAIVDFVYDLFQNGSFKCVGVRSQLGFDLTRMIYGQKTRFEN
jgi:hypothetical protein